MAGIDLFVILDEREVPVEVDPSANVGDVIDALKAAVGPDGSVIGFLEWQGETLNDNDKSLADLGICPGSRVVFRTFDPALTGFEDPTDDDRFGVARFEVPRFAGTGEMVFANVVAAKVRSRSGDDRCFIWGPKMPDGCRAWEWRARQFLPSELNAKIEEGAGFGSEFKVSADKIDSGTDVAMNLYTGVMTPGIDEQRCKRSGLYDCRQQDAGCKLWLAVNDVCWTNDQCEESRQNLGASMKAGKEILYTYRQGDEQGKSTLSLRLVGDDGETVEEKIYKNVPPELRFFTQIDKHAAGVALTYCGPPRE